MAAKSILGKRGSVRITVLLTSVFGGLTAISLALVLVISAYTGFSGTRSLMRGKAMLTLDTLQRGIGQHLNPALFLIRHISSMVENDDLDITNKPQLITTLKASLAAAPQISGVSVWQKNKRLIRVTRQKSGASIVVSRMAPESPEITKFLDNVRLASGPVWGGPYREGGKSYVVVTAPLFYNGEFLGTIGTGISINELSAYVSTLGRQLDMTAFILYGDKHILAHPYLNNKETRKLFEQNTPLLSLKKLADPVLLKMATAKARKSLKEYNFSSYRVKTAAESYLVLSRPLQNFGKTPWRIGVYGPQAALTAEIVRLRASIAFGFILLVIAVGAAVYLARKIATPIREIASSATRIGSFELGDIAPLKASRITELNEQASAFNQMLNGLKSFETYVPHRLVKRLISDETGQCTASREAELTLMFTDIIGFTAISEHLTPAQTAQMLNSHFEYVNSCIEQSGGTLDKYIGDATMAFWGAPEQQRDHAKRAARAALCIARRIDEQPSDSRWPDLRIKIALHTGPLIVGNIGAKSRMNYTIIGDTVNTCSRIEALSGQLGKGEHAIIIVSDETAALIRDDFTLEPVGTFPIKGREKPVKLWRMIQQP